jgi:hypothetical protein
LSTVRVGQKLQGREVGMSRIKSKHNIPMTRDVKIVQSLTLTKPELIQLPHEETYLFERQVTQADKEHQATSGIEPIPVPQESVLCITGPRPVYKNIDFNDYRFVFKYETGNPDMLYIYARHLVTADDAIGIFFSYDPIRNEQWNRFETYSETHGLYWRWCNENNKKKKVVMVISCFK